VNLDKNRRWFLLAASAWLLLVLHIGASVLLVSIYQPKLVLDRSGGIVPDSASISFGSQLYQWLALVWLYNRFLVPGMLLLAIALTVVAWRARARSHGLAPSS